MGEETDPHLAACPALGFLLGLSALPVVSSGFLRGFFWIDFSGHVLPARLGVPAAQEHLVLLFVGMMR